MTQTCVTTTHYSTTLDTWHHYTRSPSLLSAEITFCVFERQCALPLNRVDTSIAYQTEFKTNRDTLIYHTLLYYKKLNFILKQVIIKYTWTFLLCFIYFYILYFEIYMYIWVSLSVCMNVLLTRWHHRRIDFPLIYEWWSWIPPGF